MTEPILHNWSESRKVFALLGAAFAASATIMANMIHLLPPRFEVWELYDVQVTGTVMLMLAGYDYLVELRKEEEVTQ